MSGQHAMTVKRDRHAAIRRVVTARAVASQGELVAELSALGFDVTQATVSRDVAELGLAKVMRGDRSIYVVPEAIGARRPPSDERLRRILADIPVTVARSGLILVLVGQPGTASVIAQAIDESTLSEQVGTLAGDNTLIVLFSDEPALLGWLERFEAINAPAEPVASLGVAEVTLRLAAEARRAQGGDEHASERI
jgi:transcriptional regulator of arginine metabolism